MFSVKFPTGTKSFTKFPSDQLPAGEFYSLANQPIRTQGIASPTVTGPLGLTRAELGGSGNKASCLWLMTNKTIRLHPSQKCGHQEREWLELWEFD